MRRLCLTSSVRTEHTPIDLTHTPHDFPLSGAQLHLSDGPRLPTPHATAAHGHTPNQHRFCDCSSCPSIHRECGDRVSHFHHSSRRAVFPLGPQDRSGTPSHSQARSVPATSCREVLSDSRMQTQPPQSQLLQVSSSREQSRPFCANDPSYLRAPRSFSLILLVHLASLLILSTVSGTSSTACIVCSATSSARVSGYAPLQRI